MQRTARLPYTAPLNWTHMLRFLGLRAIPGVEEVIGSAYRRTLRLLGGAAVVALGPGDGCIECVLELTDPRDLPLAVQRCRRLLDLDLDPAAPDAHLVRDPLLGPLVLAAPGLRVPGAVDGSELAIRAVLGQQVSVAAARTTAARMTRTLGDPLPVPDGGLTHLFPTPRSIADADLATLRGPVRRRRTLQALAAALADGDIVLDPGADRAPARAGLLSITGIGPWTVEYIAMRALADQDAFLPTDLGVRHALERLGGPAAAEDAMALAEAWRPWRAYAVQHLLAGFGGRGRAVSSHPWTT